MQSVAEAIVEHLKPLIGLRLVAAGRAADMRNFQFGQTRSTERRTIGEYALHVQCSWRIEGSDGICTGRADLWEPANASTDADLDKWDYDEDENLQDRQLCNLLGNLDSTSQIVNQTEHFIVEQVQADNCGGMTIQLSGGYRLVIFPAGTRGEDWRLFQPDSGQPHFVVAG